MSGSFSYTHQGKPLMNVTTANPQQDAFIPVIRLIEKQVEKKSQQTAFVYGQQQITFFELNQCANQVAHYLQQLGVQKNQFVPVCIDRSIEMMIAMLAIFKVGATYVPLDPSHPVDRIEFMLNDLQATQMFATAATRQKLISYGGQVVEVFENDSTAISKQPGENLSLSIDINDTAYVIYTSGSTGRPKGVMVEQGAMFNYMVNSSTRFIHDNDNPFGSYIHLSNTFDASLTSLFMPMLAGKSAVISSTSGSDAFNDENFLKYAPYDFLNITPAHLDFLVATVTDPAKWVTKRLVIGGEALYTGHFDFFVENNIPLEIINLYGPTEATIGCTTYGFWLSDIQNQSKEIPIGAPIGETAIYLLQQNGEELEEADTGEICIGGLTLAKGYLNRADLTSEKFIDNPIKNSKWPRLYKTGDLGKWLPDGNLAYCGRIDNQVKISGYRIELGEIESVVNSMQYVNNSCVVAQGESVKKLVCFVSPLYDKIMEEIGAFTADAGDTAELTSNSRYESIHQWLQNEITTFLGERLPKYMVPPSFVFLKQFRLTSSGKIDRKALLSLQNKVVHRNKPSRAASQTEKILIDTWQTALSIEHIQVNDNFFEIGGNSLQAARMFNLIRKHFGRQLPVSTLLKAPTVEQLAELLAKKVDKRLRDIIVPFRTKGSKPPLYLIHGGAGDVLFYKELAEFLHDDQPVYAIMPRGMDGKEPPVNSIEKMASLYIKKIKAIQSKGPYFLGGYCFGATVAVEMANQLKLNGEKVAFLANINGVSPGYIRKKVAIKSSARMESSKRIQQHLNSNASMVTSIGREAIFKMKCLKACLVNAVYWKATAGFLIKMNLPLPARLAKEYYVTNNDAMLQKHKLKSYKGDMIIFRSSIFAPEPAMGWEEQIDGKIIMHEIPGNHGDRQQILKHPFVAGLAEKVQECLHEAHAANPVV